MPEITKPQVSRVLRELLPRREWTHENLLAWLQHTQKRNEQPKRSHAKRRLNRQRDPSL